MTQGGTRPHVAPARLLRALRDEGRRAARADRRRAGRDLGRVQRARPAAAITALGVLVTFALLVQFGELPRRALRAGAARPARRHAAPPRGRGAAAPARRAPRRRVARQRRVSRRRTSLFVDGRGTELQRGTFLAVLPIVLGTTYVVYVLSGVYRRAWRYATARDLLTIALASGIATLVAYGIVARDARPRRLPGARLRSSTASPPPRSPRSRAGSSGSCPRRGGGADDGRRRVLVVGAGQAGRGVVRDLPGATTSSSSASSTTTRGSGAGACRACRCSARSATPPPPSRRRAPTSSSSRSPSAPADAARGSRSARATRPACPTASCANGPARRPRRREPSPSERRMRRHGALPASIEDARRGSRACCRSSARTSSSRRSTRGRPGGARRRRSSRDELETTQISRAIAETGHAARRGEPYGFTSLVPWLTAPFWWLHPVATAYEAIKTVQAFVMAAAIFPAFLLARRVLSPGWAYFAAVAAIAAPGALVRADPRRGAVGVPGGDARPLAHGARGRPPRALAARARVRLVPRSPSLVRSQLVRALRRARLRAARARLAHRADAPLAGVVVALGLGRRRRPRRSARVRRGRRVPRAPVERVVDGDDALEGPDGRVRQLGGRRVRDRDRRAPRDRAPRGARRAPAPSATGPGVRAFVVVTGGAVVSFGWYAAIKGAYLSTTFSSLIVERNLVYLAPLAFVATAYLLERAAAPRLGRPRRRSGGARADRLGADRPRARQLPVLRGARPGDPRPREPRVGVAARADRDRARRRDARRDGAPRAARHAPASAAAGDRGAGGGGHRRRSSSSGTSPPRCTRRSASTTSAPASRRTSRSRTTGSTVRRTAARSSMLGQRMSDNPLGVASTEFWNRSIAKVWSVDGTGPGPGHTLTPDLQDVDGTLSPGPADGLRPRVERGRGRRRRGRRQPGGERDARPADGADPAALERDGDRRRRLDRRRPRRPERPRARGLQPLRRLRGRDGHGGRHAVARDVLPGRRAAPGGRPRPDRRSWPRRRQAARDRPRDGLGDGVRAGLRDTDSRAADARRRRGASRSRSRRSCRRRSTRRRAAASGARWAHGSTSTSFRASERPRRGT